MSEDLQQLYHEICDEERQRYYYGPPTGYQARCATEAGRRIGRKLIEEEMLYMRLQRWWPWGAPEWREVANRLGNLEPAIRGNTKTFYVVRDVIVAIRDIKRRPLCAMCAHRYHPNDEHEESKKWTPLVWASRQRYERMQWSCSRRCFRRAQQKLDKEILWLKIAKQRQTEVRRYLRNSRAA